MLLTEIEKHDGLIILATNRPFDLDEAMQRRITISIGFRQPDHLLRKKIWERHLPPALKLAPDVDMGLLAMKFELTGGFIKNGNTQQITQLCFSNPICLVVGNSKK